MQLWEVANPHPAFLLAAKLVKTLAVVFVTAWFQFFLPISTFQPWLAQSKLLVAWHGAGGISLRRWVNKGHIPFEVQVECNSETIFLQFGCVYIYVHYGMYSFITSKVSYAFILVAWSPGSWSCHLWRCEQISRCRATCSSSPPGTLAWYQPSNWQTRSVKI